MKQVLPTISLFLVCCLATTEVIAQSGHENQWKKIVGRTIEWPNMKPTTKNSLKDLNGKNGVFEEMARAALAGKVPAYKINNGRKGSQLSTKDIAGIFEPVRDTIIVIDPITGEEVMKTRGIPFDYRSVNKYRIVEKWLFNPDTKQTEFAVIGIIPMQDMYANDGQFMAVNGLFYLRYDDVKDIIATYEEYHPENTLSSRIWSNYFGTDATPERD